MTLNPTAPDQVSPAPAYSAEPPVLARVTEPRLPDSLVVLTLLFALTHAVLLLLLQPLAYWLSPEHALRDWYTPLLAGGPLLFGLGVALYLLVCGLLLVRLPRVAALTLAGLLFFFHFTQLIWQGRYGWPPFLRLTTMISADIFQVCIWLVLLPAGWVLWRALTPAAQRAWEHWLGRAALLAWLFFLAGSLGAVVAPAFFSLIASEGWRPLATAHHPPERSFAAVAYDPIRRQAVLFGGLNDSNWDALLTGQDTYLDDTWLWDGNDWTQVTPTGEIPAARKGASMGYDATRGVMVLYGGENSSGQLSDMWEWNGTAWRKLCPVCTPAARSGHKTLYDPELEKMVIYGGFADGAKEPKWYSEGWYWNGTCWSSAYYKNASPAAQHFGAVYDTSDRRPLFFFPDGNGGSTWTFSNATNSWTQLDLPVNPDHANAPVMVYAPVTQQSVLFGGWSESGYHAETWVFDGSSWRKLSLPLQPTPRAFAAAFYDVKRNSVILFGGQDVHSYLGDTWELMLPSR